MTIASIILISYCSSAVWVMVSHMNLKRRTSEIQLAGKTRIAAVS